MGFKSLDEIIAYQVAGEFKNEVYRLLDTHPRARTDWKFADQLRDAVASIERNIAEGFGRFSIGDFSQFLRIARGSTKEALTEIQDGIDRGHFPREECRHALSLGRREMKLVTALLLSQRPFLSPKSPVHGPGGKTNKSAKVRKKPPIGP